MITGTVTDPDGEGLPGANVIIEGQQIGVSTNVDGEYFLEVPGRLVDGRTVTLEASFVGYRSSTADVTLEEGEITQDFTLEPDHFALDELVVTGVVGETPTRKLAFSVDRISAADLGDVPATTAAGALQGKIAGVNVISSGGRPGGAPDIRLRGSTSLTGGQSPLMIVDGVIVEGTMADIDAHDIESIEVVKGAAAASLYGSRAANGVIQIFTNRGGGLAEGRTQVSVRNEFGMSFLGSQMPLAEHHPYMVNEAGEYIDGDGNVLDFGATRIPEDPDRLHAVNPYSQVNDLQRQVFDPGSFYTNYVAVSRNHGTGNYQVSFSNTSEEGIIYGQTGYGRQNVRLNVDQQITTGLDVRVSAMYAQSESDELDEGPGSPFFGLLFFQPDADLFAENPNGEPFYLHADPYSVETNPLYDIHNNHRQRDRSRFMGDGRVTWSPLAWFTLEGNFSMDRQGETFQNYFPRGYLEDVGGLEPAPGDGSQWLQTFNETALNTGLTATFTNEYGPLTSRLRLSYLYEESDYEFFRASGSDFGISGIPTLDAISGSTTVRSSHETVRSEYLFGILGVDLHDRYIADFLVRRDGSSLFGPDDRYHTYFRVSGAYRLAEDFDIPGVDEFRLRASVGTAGLTPVFAAQYETFSVADGVPSKSTLGNRELSPAFSLEQEYGVNITLLERYDFTFTYANTVTEDQILLVPLAASAGGFQNQWRNAGTLEANTFEASFDAVLMDREDLQWSASVNFDRTRQRTTHLNPDVPPFFTGPVEQGAAVFYVAPGEPFGVIYGNRWARSLDELPSDLNPDDYMINSDGYVVNRYTPDGGDAKGTIHEAPVHAVDEDGETVMPIGDINPDFNMGFSSRLSFGGFSFYTLLDWKQGGDVYNQTRQWIYRDQRHADFDQSGVPEDQRKSVNYYEAFYDANNVNDFFVEDGSYLKLRELSVHYTLGNTFFSRMGLDIIERARIGVVGRNLLTFTGYSGYDPEVAGISGDATNFMFDGFGYPNFRTFTGSLEIVF